MARDMKKVLAQRKLFKKRHPNYQREYYLAHKDAINAKKREYVKAHWSKIKKFNAKYYKKNRKYFRKYYRRYYQEHKDEYRRRRAGREARG